MLNLIKGGVVYGDAVGRTIGFPTANLDQVPSVKDLQLGVYVGQCQILNSQLSNSQLSTEHNCLIYFGPRFILGKTQNSFEVYLYDFQGDLYGQTLTVQIQKFIRPPIKFDNLEALKDQLQKDQERGRLLLSHD